MSYRKDRGYQSEEIVAQWCRDQGYEVLEQNRTMRGGELDIVARDGGELVIIEVKDVSAMHDDLIGYVTPSKLKHLRRSIQKYTQYAGWESDYRLDVVFVRDNRIQDVCTVE